MIIDTSAVFAILLDEPERDEFTNRLAPESGRGSGSPTKLDFGGHTDIRSARG